MDRIRQNLRGRKIKVGTTFPPEKSFDLRPFAQTGFNLLFELIKTCFMVTRYLGCQKLFVNCDLNSNELDGEQKSPLSNYFCEK